MKKLTAGIFTVILGLTTVDAFAAIPTQAYVDSAVEYALEQAEAAQQTANAAAPQATTYTKTEVDNLVNGVSGSLTGYVTDGEFTEFQTSNTAAIADAKKAGTDAATAAQAAATAAAAAQQTADAAAPQATTYTKTEVDNLVNGVSGSLAGYVTDGEFTEFQTSNTAAIADAKKAGTDAATAAAAAATAAAAAQQTADSKLQVTGTCPAGATCYLDATGAIQVAVDTFDSSKLNGASTN